MAKGSSKKREEIMPTSTTTMASKVDNQVEVLLDGQGVHIAHPIPIMTSNIWMPAVSRASERGNRYHSGRPGMGWG